MMTKENCLTQRQKRIMMRVTEINCDKDLCCWDKYGGQDNILTPDGLTDKTFRLDKKNIQTPDNTETMDTGKLEA